MDSHPWFGGAERRRSIEPYRSRREAGRRLAALLEQYRGRDDVAVLALPRGGVPVAFEVAAYLDASLDVYTVRKLGVPGHEELGFGAIASGGVRVLNEPLVQSLGLPQSMIEHVSDRERQELERQEQEYRGSRGAPDVAGKTVILVDDGLATGSTMRAAVHALRALTPAHVVVAAPVGSRQACEEFRGEADVVVCAMTPEPFLAVGAWYEDFSQTTGEQVRQLLEEAWSRQWKAR